MPNDVLKLLGIQPEPDEHPANKDVLNRLGLKPEPDEHPAQQRMIGDRPLEDWEITPGAKNPNPPSPPSTMNQVADTLQGVREATDPFKLGAKAFNNYVEHAAEPTLMMRRGAGELFNNQPASGIGHIGLGGLGLVGAGIQTAVTDPLTAVTGNPDFAEKASMLVPMPIGSGAAKGANTVTKAVNDLKPSVRAVDLLAERMTPEALERLRGNPRLRPMDVSKGVRDIAVGAAKDTSQPEAMAHVVSSMERSAATAKDAVRGTYDASLGEAPPNLFKEYERLQQQAQTIGKTKIQPALDAAGPVDTSKVIEDIDKVLKPGVQAVATPGVPFHTRLQSELMEWRQELMKDGSLLTDPNRLHEVQSDMRRYAQELMMSPDGQSKRLGRQIMEYRSKLVDAIDGKAPGYKNALAEYKDAIDIQKAFDFGRDVLKNTNDIHTDPSYLEQWVNHSKRSPEELEAARLGARQAIESKMGSIKSSGLDAGRSGTDVPQIDFNRQKLEHLFGKDKTDQMFRHLQDERDIAVTNSRGLSNSTTAEAHAAQRMLEPRPITPAHSQLPHWALAMGAGAGALTSPTVGALVGGGLLATRGAKMAYDWAGRQSDIARNATLAHLISRNDPATIEQLAAAMTRIQQTNRSNKLNHLLTPP